MDAEIVGEEDIVVCIMVECMTSVVLMIANRKSVLLSGKPWKVPFSWGCMDDNLSAN